MPEKTYITKKEFDEFTGMFSKGQNEIKEDLRILTASIQGDSLGNKGLVPQLQSHQVQIEQLNKAHIRFEKETTRINNHQDEIENHRERISNLERFRSYILGGIAMASAVGALVGIVVSWVNSVINGG